MFAGFFSVPEVWSYGLYTVKLLEFAGVN